MAYIHIQVSVDLPELDRLELERSLDVLLARMREHCDATTVLAITDMDADQPRSSRGEQRPAYPPLL